MNSYKIRNVSTAQAYPILTRNRFQKSPVIQVLVVPTSLVRYAYYAFVFSLPLEKADIEIGEVSLSRMLGFLLVAVMMAAALLQKRRFHFELPPKAFWWFAGYLVVYAALGYNIILSDTEGSVLAAEVVQGIKTLVQLLIVFWVSYNLFRYERIIKGSLVTLTASCILVAVLQSLGITDSITSQDRLAAFDANENLIAEVLSLGLLIVAALAYVRDKTDLKTRLLFWLGSGGLALSIVVTGSRGAMIALISSLLVFFLNGKSLKVKLKVGLAVVLAVGILGWLSYVIEPVRERWAATYYEGDTAGRDVLFSAAWEMFLEKPITGWGPANNIAELGSRLGLRKARDPHNTYLWLLTETGLLGAVPFLIGLWFCLLAAWRSRTGAQGALPMSLLVFLLISGMKGTNYTDKLFWVVLAYTFAHITYPSVSTGVRLQVATGNHGSQASIA